MSTLLERIRKYDSVVKDYKNQCIACFDKETKIRKLNKQIENLTREKEELSKKILEVSKRNKKSSKKIKKFKLEGEI